MLHKTGKTATSNPSHKKLKTKKRKKHKTECCRVCEQITLGGAHSVSVDQQINPKLFVVLTI